jgi:hypothetical protein
VVMRLDSLSKNIVNIMKSLANNEGLARLLLHNVPNPEYQTAPEQKNNIANPSSEYCRIFPYPFDPEAQIEDQCFIRVYYNDGEFNENEVISETRLHIDIICAKSLWLVQGGKIRPYEIMALVTDMIGKRGLNTTIKLKFDCWQHLAVNTKFDCIRLYSEYWTVEA